MPEDTNDPLHDNLTTLFSAHAYDPDTIGTSKTAPAGPSRAAAVILAGLAVAAAVPLYFRMRGVDDGVPVETSRASDTEITRGDWILRVDAASGTVVAQDISEMAVRTVRAGEPLGDGHLKGVRVDAVLTEGGDWRTVGEWNEDLRAALRGECESIAEGIKAGGVNSSDIHRLGFLGHRGEARALSLLESIVALGGEHGAIALELLNGGKEVASVRQLVERAYSGSGRISQSAVRALAKSDSLLARRSLCDLAMKGEEHAAISAVGELARTRDRYDAGLWQALSAGATSAKVRSAAAEVLAGIEPDLPGEDGNETNR